MSALQKKRKKSHTLSPVLFLLIRAFEAEVNHYTFYFLKWLFNFKRLHDLI